ncbi:DUF2190 family protein [Sphingomonas sp. SRS2]|uniref:DUF2190 family protein n=1 Tax=Sphingomonas sp. SRS2 TaxID=133190 RepID=UPI000A01914F|nr:DUF2190 family protein [Sphingomonas sp. SRS2]
MARIIQPEGDALPLIAPAGGVVALRGVLIGALFVVATIDADEGEPFIGRRRGVFELAAAVHATNQAAAAGDSAYWDATAKKITKTATGNMLVGVFVEDKVSTVALAKVVLVPRIAAAGAAIADAGGGDNVAAVVVKLNILLAELRAAGVILT